MPSAISIWPTGILPGAYETGAKESTQNGIAKAMVLLRLGEIYWDKEDYINAQRCYAELVGILDKENEAYKEAERRSGILTELEPHLSAIKLQDSLQWLAKLPENERNEAIDKVIEALKKQEKEEARKAMQALIDNGYCHGLLAGNALGTHDLEGALLHTALGQDIYTQQSQPNGHYNHLDVLNKVRRCGSIPKFIEEYHIDNGIIYGCVKNHVPFVLTGSIRDDGPLPEVYANAYEGASAMRELVRKSTTVICLATMLHTIATGNMTPSFRVMPDGSIRPVYLYAVDAAEFVVNKLLDRGSLSATTMVTNVQDFIGKVAGGLGLI